MADNYQMLMVNIAVCDHKHPHSKQLQYFAMDTKPPP